MDVDGKGMVYVLCQWGWPVFLLMGTMGASIVSPLSASVGVDPAARVPKEFPIIKPMDAASAQSRSQYSVQKCSRELKKFKEILMEKNTPDRTNASVVFVVKFTVQNADLIYGQALQAKMTEKPTARQICSESLCVVLEQILPFAKDLEYYETFIRQLSVKYGLLFDVFKRELGRTTHLSKNQPDDGSGMRTAFEDTYAEKMEQKTNSIAKQYDDLFTVKDCPEEILPLLNEYAGEIRESMANVEMHFGSFQIAAALNRATDALFRFIVSKANEFSGNFPDIKLSIIYRAISVRALQFALPTFSVTGSLWPFANGLKNGGIPSFRKALETKFQLLGTHIIHQDSPAEEEKQNVDQANQTETEKYIAERRKREEEQRRQAAAEKFIVVQIDIIMEWLLETTRNYLDIFQKRNSSNWPI
jgi:hypothetical protein